MRRLSCSDGAEESGETNEGDKDEDNGDKEPSSDPGCHDVVAVN